MPNRVDVSRRKLLKEFNVSYVIFGRRLNDLGRSTWPSWHQECSGCRAGKYVV
ncbi:hypothetical protein PENANT_c006G05215 [Penicillium antarcticum]|uniref:Uncharacterized protein n=1 Tax=Penicillium antarcticum TaxID=416450 RepID=A0A1V6QD90_9EURO|nr:hypothetical protein PENANT_c006G05215 [Penicillium antarcticum]